MATHSSATVRGEAPYVTGATRIETGDSLRRRAQAVINDKAIDPHWRNMIRYALEINDPMLAHLVQRMEDGETGTDTIDLSRTLASDQVEFGREKIEALSEIICQVGAKPAAALFVLMGTLEHSTEARVLANAAKRFAFTRCCESDFYGIVDAQIRIVESELLAAAPEY